MLCGEKSITNIYRHFISVTFCLFLYWLFFRDLGGSVKAWGQRQGGIQKLFLYADFLLDPWSEGANLHQCIWMPMPAGSCHDHHRQHIREREVWKLVYEANQKLENMRRFTNRKFEYRLLKSIQRLLQSGLTQIPLLHICEAWNSIFYLVTSS